MKRTCSIIVALAISLFIYLFYRSEKTVVNELMILILSLDTYTALKASMIQAMPLSKPVIFSLPGGLWIFCTTMLSRNFYIKFRDHKVQAALIPLLFAIGLEFCQLVHLTYGTFDIWDIAFYLAFWLLACYSLHGRGLQQDILSPFTLPGFICVASFLSVYLAHVSR